jgi:hypothetical protein
MNLVSLAGDLKRTAASTPFQWGAPDIPRALYGMIFRAINVIGLPGPSKKMPGEQWARVRSTKI